MLRRWHRSIFLASGCLLLPHCYITAAGVWCDNPAPACPDGLSCDETNHCAVGSPDAGANDAGANATDAGPDDGGARTTDAGPEDAGERKPDAGSGDAGSRPAPDAGTMRDDAGPFDAGPPVCGFDPTCMESGVPTCAVRCPAADICDLSGHCQSPRYLATDAGTVIDQVTGLTWQQDTPPNECSDNDGFCTLAHAQSYCAGLQLGGLTSGWTLPTADQLFSLIQGYIATNTQLIGSAFTDTSQNFDNPYWSSDENESTGTNWVVDFSSGDIGAAPNDPTGAEAVRCVHP